MKEVKEVNIKNRTYYFFDDMVDIKNSNLLKIYKKTHKDVDIYYVGYITIKKFSDCENIHSVNPLYLIIHFATGNFKERYGDKYLIVDSIENMKKFFLELNQRSKRSMVEKNCFMEKDILKLELILTIIYF